MNSKTHKTIAPAGTEKIQKYTPFVLAALILCVYLPGNKEFFALDDPQYVTNNELIRHLSFDNIKAIFKKPFNGNYHPLTMLSLALDYKLHKLDPAGYYLTSVLIHALNSILLFFFILKLNRQAWIAAGVAALFALHPMHVESVAWISERKDQLYVLFYLSSLLAYLRYLHTNQQVKYLVYTGLFFLCSLLSKGQAVTLPLALLLVDYVTGRKINRSSLPEKIPFFILSLVFGLVAYYSQKNAGAVISEIASNIPFTERIMLAFYALWNYIYKLVLPIQFSVMHPYPLKTGGSYPWLVYASPLIIIALFGFVVWKWRSNKHVMFGLGFFLVNIVLLLQLIPVGGTIFSERYSYLSYVGLFYIIATGIFYAWQHSKNKPVITGLLACYLLFMIVATHARKNVWSSNKKLWANVIEQYPDLSYSYLKLGFIYYRESNSGANRQKADSAFINLDKAVKLGWKSVDVFGLRGDVNTWLGRPDSATLDYSKALTFGEDPLVRYRRGLLYAQAPADPGNKNSDSAIVDFKRVLISNPDEGMMYVYLGNLYLKKGLRDTASVYFHKALSKNIDANMKRNVEGILKKEAL